MNFHIMIDDKFTDYFIEDAERVAKGKNRYFIRGDSERRIYVRNMLAEWLQFPHELSIKNIFKEIRPTDRLFVHWYDLEIGKLVLSLDPSIPVFVPITGGDFYEDPFLFHRKRVYEKNTLKLIRQRFIYPQKWARRPWKLANQIIEIFKREKEIINLFPLKAETVARINFFLVVKKGEAELNLVKQIYNLKKLNSLYFFYNQNFESARRINQKKNSSKSLIVQVGNSATYSNNHLDLIPLIKKFNGEEVKFNLPLSYGDTVYRTTVKNAFYKYFRGKVEFIESFLSREEYVNYLNNVEICIMYHNRSQALGNCVTLLTLGKKLYLRRNNPLFQMFGEMGILVFDANKIKRMNFDEFKEPLSQIEVKNNIEQLEKNFSESERLRLVSNILN